MSDPTDDRPTLDSTRGLGDEKPVDSPGHPKVLAGIASAHHDLGHSIPDRREQHEQLSNEHHGASGGR